MEKSVFATLAAINCNDHIEKKNGLTYLSWAWAWQIAKTNFPDANYTIYDNPDGWNYFTDGRTCWVKTGVTIAGQEHIEELPVMDYNNRSIPLERVTSFEVNKAIQRSLTKALARHGLGLYIYAGEDLPDAADDAAREATNAEIKAATHAPAPETPKRAALTVPHGLQNITGKQYAQYVAGVASGARDEQEVIDGLRQFCGAGDTQIGIFQLDVEMYAETHKS